MKLTDFSIFKLHAVKWPVLLLTVFFALGVTFNILYFTSTSYDDDLNEFVENLHKRETDADNYLRHVRNLMQHKGLWSLSHDEKTYQTAEDEDFSCFVIDSSGDLIFWSDDEVDLSSIATIPFKKVCYAILRRERCMAVELADEKYRYIALVKICNEHKQGTPLKHEDFADCFNMPDGVMFANRGTDKSVPVFSNSGEYLFSLIMPIPKAHSSWLFWSGIACWIAVVVCLCWLCVRFIRIVKTGRIGKFSFLGCFILVIVVVLLACDLKWPDLIFDNALFSPLYYASDCLPSMGHLVVYTLLVLGCVFVVTRIFSSLPQTKLEGMRRVLLILLCQIVSSLPFVGIYLLSCDFIANSSLFDIAVSSVQNVSVVTFAAVLLMLIWAALCIQLVRWLMPVYSDMSHRKMVVLCRLGFIAAISVVLAGMGVSLNVWMAFTYFALCTLFCEWCCYIHKHPFWYVTALAFLSIIAVIEVSYELCDVRNLDRFQMYADNMTNNHSLVYDERAEIRMKQISDEILKDKELSKMITDSALSEEAHADGFKQKNSVSTIEKYVTDKYLTGPFEHFEFDVQVNGIDEDVKTHVTQDKTYALLKRDSVKRQFEKIVGSQFYASNRSDMLLAYVGLFTIGGKSLDIYLYPNLNYSQISYWTQKDPSSLFNQGHDISIVKYHNNELFYFYGDYHYPNVPLWIPNVKKKNFHFYSGNFIHFVSRFDNNNGMVVVTKPIHHAYVVLIFVSYLCAFYALCGLLFMLSNVLIRWRHHARKSILGRLQLWFLIPLLLAFSVMGTFSVFFFMDQYTQQQVKMLSFRANAVQSHLRTSAVDNSKAIEDVNTERLSENLHKLSTLFQADIEIYNNKGFQVISSRSNSINNGNLVNSCMYPKPIFMSYPDYFRREIRSGSVFYTYYTRLYNRKNEMLGYVKLISYGGTQKIPETVFNILVILVDIYLIIIVLSVLVSWFVSNHITKPVSLLALKFKEVKLTGDNSRITYDEDDEFGLLVEQYNNMVDQLHESAEQLAQSQREYAWRDMARRIAHEIKNPLTPMKLSVQMAQLKMNRDPEHFNDYFNKTANTLIEQIDNLSRIASSFSTFAKSTVMNLEKVDLAEKVQSVVSLFQNNQEGVAFNLNMHGIDSATVMTDRQQILQVFNNLFRNAIQAIPEDRKGIINVDLQKIDNRVIVKVTDNGCGIPEENRQTIFEPNFTTKTSGMGLGLSIVKTIIELSEGTISVISEVNVGTTFTIDIALVE